MLKSLLAALACPFLAGGRLFKKARQLLPQKSAISKTRGHDCLDYSALLARLLPVQKSSLQRVQKIAQSPDISLLMNRSGMVQLLEDSSLVHAVVTDEVRSHGLRQCLPDDSFRCTQHLLESALDEGMGLILWPIAWEQCQAHAFALAVRFILESNIVSGSLAKAFHQNRAVATQVLRQSLRNLLVKNLPRVLLQNWFERAQ